MSRAPRILPLIAIAIGGVLAMKAIGAFEAAPALPQGRQGPRRSRRAAARRPRSRQGRRPKPATPRARAAPPPRLFDARVQRSAAPAARHLAPRAERRAVKASTGSPVCAPTAAELAKEAGLSPAELQVLQSLQARRGQLDQREQALQTELALFAAAEAKVDSKLKTPQRSEGPGAGPDGPGRPESSRPRSTGW